MTFFAGIPQRIGYTSAKRAFLLTKKIPPPKKDSCHRIDYYLGVVEKAGLKVEDRYLEFFTDDMDEKFVDKFLKSEGIDKKDIVIGINPGGNWLPKRWPKEYFARLCDRLIGDLRAKIVLLGSESDRSLAKEIAREMKEKPIIAAGKFNLKQLAVFLRKTDLFVSADTGPLHIANAVGAKNIIALFGPTCINITGPYPLTSVILLQKDAGCIIPCYKVDCKDNRCMKAITPQDVIDKIKLPKKC